MRERTYRECTEIIGGVLLFVQENLDRSLDVDCLANVASISPFHFQRVFHRLVGENVIEHVRRIRLERAAYQLRNTSESVSSIAVDAQFESLSAFSRAFETAYGTAPSRFRDIPRILYWQPSATGIHYGPIAEFDFHPLANRDVPSSAQVLCRDSVDVIALRHDGPLQFIDSTWLRFLSLLQENEVDCSKHRLITFSDHVTQPVRTAEIRGFAAIDWAEDLPGLPGLERRRIESGRYLVKRHRGSGHLLTDFWFRTWIEDLLGRGLKPRSGAAYQVFASAIDATDPAEFLTDIYIPVAETSISCQTG